MKNNVDLAKEITTTTIHEDGNGKLLLWFRMVFQLHGLFCFMEKKWATKDVQLPLVLTDTLTIIILYE